MPSTSLLSLVHSRTMVNTSPYLRFCASVCVCPCDSVGACIHSHVHVSISTPMHDVFQQLAPPIRDVLSSSSAGLGGSRSPSRSKKPPATSSFAGPERKGLAAAVASSAELGPGAVTKSKEGGDFVPVTRIPITPLKVCSSLVCVCVWCMCVFVSVSVSLPLCLCLSLCEYMCVQVCTLLRWSKLARPITRTLCCHLLCFAPTATDLASLCEPGRLEEQRTLCP